MRGRGLVYALESKKDDHFAADVQQRCYEQQMIVETCGSKGQALKPLPSLTISTEELERGLDIIAQACAEVVSARKHKPRVVQLAV